MERLIELIFNGLPVESGLLMAGMSLASSFITASMGIGGGVLLLAVMASLFPPLALIPVHGVIQLGSNFFRAVLMLAHVQWRVVAAFAAGSVLGVVIGGSVAVQLEPAVVQIGIGAFVLWSVFRTPPAWLAKAGGLTGLASSFLTMFFGATGPFVANYVKSLTLPRQAHVSTHAVLMTIQHSLKSLTFGFLGFAFGPWAGFILLMIAMGFLGTVLGKRVLMRLDDRKFSRALNLALLLISARLIWLGASTLLAG